MSEREFQQRSRPRLLEVIRADIRVQSYVMKKLNDLALDFINCSLPSLVWDGTTVERIGVEPVPPQLRQMIADESMKFATLINEYREALQVEAREEA